MIYPGHIISVIADFARRSAGMIKVDNHQGNGAYGVHQARVTLPDDPTTYRLRAKAEGGRPFIAIPKNCEHLWGPGDAMFDVARELAAQS